MSCQSFGKMQKSEKKSDLQKAGHIKMLARMYHGLRIAHVDEVNGTFFSVLSKHAGTGGDDMVEEYRVRVRNIVFERKGERGDIWNVCPSFSSSPRLCWLFLCCRFSRTSGKETEGKVGGRSQLVFVRSDLIIQAGQGDPIPLP